MDDRREATMGDKVRAHLVICLADGLSVEDTRADDEPVTTVLGTADVHPCIERALVGLKIGEQRTLELAPAEAFGERETGATHMVARSSFPAEISLDIGVVVAFDSAMGQPVAGTVVRLDDMQAEVDFNHPLAGRDVTLEVELINIE